VDPVVPSGKKGGLSGWIIALIIILIIALIGGVGNYV
jgi:hypothetical protein